MSPTTSKAAEAASKRYDRIASLYDVMQGWMDRDWWRRLLWSKVQGPRVLEVGVGTGKNFSYYPQGLEITAIDFSRGMLSRAAIKAQKDHISTNLLLMDVESLSFPDDAFDSVIASFVFCSVPDPVRGLKEVRRVCKPEGKVLLLEHIRSPHPFWGRIMDWLNPLVVRLSGSTINRNTLANVEESGLHIRSTTDLWLGIVHLIEAHR